MKNHIINRAAELYTRCDTARKSGGKVAVVPTMGALHAGHLSLVEMAKAQSDFLVVTIFVNPTQFGPGEDFDKYPRTLDSDIETLTPYDVDLIFAPTREEVYPKGYSTNVALTGITDGLCGAFRPDHFDGVTTVVTKLLNMVGPCGAVFGKKDYQQLQVIKRLVTDLNIQATIHEAPIVREKDGLAMSSRNAYLSPDERNRALNLSRGLAAAHALYQRGETAVSTLVSAVKEPIRAAADSVDYITAAHPTTLKPIDDKEHLSGKLLIAVAARIGSTRLIDNIVLGEDPSPV